MATVKPTRGFGMRQMKLAVACLIIVSVNLAQAADRNYQADPALYDLMDELPAALFSYTGHPSSMYWPKQVSAAPHLRIYAPDTQEQATNRVIAAYQQGGRILEDLFQAGSLDEVKVFIVEEITSSNDGAQALRVSGELVIMIELSNYTEHSFLHEYMHILQRMTGAHPYDQGLGALLANTSDYDQNRRWYVEGAPQFAPLITGAPDNWINKPLLYQGGDNSGRFSQAMRQAHGKSLVHREELASLFWYYYFMKVHSGSQPQLGSAMLSYRDNGFDNEGMSWFSFGDHWHDFALSHLNIPGDKTGVWDTLDGNFGMVDASARDEAEVVLLPSPFGDVVELDTLSQKYFSVEGLSDANDYVIFSLPDKEIPEGVEISAVLSRTDTGQETWKTVPITESSLGEHWFMRFPMNGEPKIDADSNIPYNDIIFVVSNYSDTDDQDLNMVITNHLREKYEGRGVELETGTQYIMTGTSILGVPRKGDGYRLVIEDDEIHTRSLQAWFQRDPILEFDTEDDLNRKALTYTRDNGVFSGDVYFKYIGMRPEEVEEIGGRMVESGKLIVNRERKENFYDTPNLFKIVLDQQDLLIMFGADVKAATAFTRQIEKIVATKYDTGTFGGTLSQLFQQTMAIDTRAYNQDYEVNYKRGRDDTGHYLKLRLGESMWFVLRDTQLVGVQKIIK
jgi:hypothetical protein